MGKRTIEVIGGGLAGCEAAWQLARRGIAVRLWEMRPKRPTPAHRTGRLSELVCSNSLKSDRVDRASGLLKAELRLAGSLLLEAASLAAIPGGTSLCVDRGRFSSLVDAAVRSHPLVTVADGEVTELPSDGIAIVASGPLTSDRLASAIEGHLGAGSLAFYDAIAPTIEGDSIDRDRTFLQDRHGPMGSGAYLNCPFDREGYLAFVRALRDAEKAPPRPFEDGLLFEACLPVEILAARGDRTLAFGPMRPVGLTDPRTGRRPYAVVQLRPEDSEGRLYGMVGFQTKLTHGAQRSVFAAIPGLENARFERLGSIHRNTYIDSPALLDPLGRSRKNPGILFAGQITGVEGYVESIASGLLAGIYASTMVRGKAADPPPATTMTGALMSRIAARTKGFSPVNAQFGLLPSVGERGGRADRPAIAAKALKDMSEYLWTLNSR